MILRSRTLTLAGVGLLALVGASVPAFAQSGSSVPPYPAACSPSSVPSTTSDSAHSIYQAGKAYYDDANYDGAIQQFREAYKKDCSKHDLLIIISRAYELKSDRQAAIGALETYLERVPTSPDAAQHRTRIENLKKQIAATPAPSATAPPPKPVEMREHTVPPWIVVGVGAITIIAGVVVLATSPANPEGCNASSQTCMRRPADTDEAFANRQKEAGTARSQPIYGAVVLGIGGAVVVGGLLWHFLEPTGPVENSTAKLKPKLTPQVSPGFAGMSLGGTF